MRLCQPRPVALKAEMISVERRICTGFFGESETGLPRLGRTLTSSFGRTSAAGFKCWKSSLVSSLILRDVVTCTSGRCYLRCVVTWFHAVAAALVMLDVATPRCRAISGCRYSFMALLFVSPNWPNTVAISIHG
jgi:hypothetical protein